MHPFELLTLLALTVPGPTRPAIAQDNPAETAGQALLPETVPASTDDGPSNGDERLRSIREIRTELLLGEPRWHVFEAPEAAAPTVRVIGPSKRLSREKQSYPTLLLAPKSRVGFAVDVEPAYGGQLHLEGFAGADEATHEWLAEHPDVVLELVLSIDDAVRARYRFERSKVGKRGWRPLGGKRGIAIEPGALIELTSSATGDTALPRTIAAGFARLAITERFEVAAQSATPERPNLVLIVMDTLRADRTPSVAGGERYSPRLNELAERGLVYESAYSVGPWTWPSTASILTGLPVETHGVVSSGESYLHGEIDTLAEVLSRAGVATAAVVGNPLIVPQQNFDQGFRAFHASREGEMTDSRDLVPIAAQWIEQHADERFFLYLHPTDPHEPLDHAANADELFPGERPDGYPHFGKIQMRSRYRMSGRELDEDGYPIMDRTAPPVVRNWIDVDYDRAVWSGDQAVGKLFDRLDELELLDRTIIAFTADHGEELLDHGGMLHGSTLYEEQVHVPLIVCGPGVPVGKRVEAPVTNRAIGPSLAQRMGVELAADEGLPDLLDPETVVEQPVFFAEPTVHWIGLEPTHVLGVRRGHFVAHFAPALGEDAVRLFDLDADPKQLTNVASEHPELVEELRKLALDQLAAERARARGAGVGGGADTRAMLEDLGYLEGGDE